MGRKKNNKGWGRSPPSPDVVHWDWVDDSNINNSNWSGYDGGMIMETMVLPVSILAVIFIVIKLRETFIRNNVK